MSPEQTQTEVPADGDLRSQFGGGIDLGSSASVSKRGPVSAGSDLDPRRSHQEIVAFKFGGTSLLGAKRMLHAASLVRPVAQSSQVVVVVSAMKGVTDRLLAMAQDLSHRKNHRARAEAEAVLRLHHDALCNCRLSPMIATASAMNSMPSAATCSMKFRCMGMFRRLRSWSTGSLRLASASARVCLPPRWNVPVFRPFRFHPLNLC